MRYFIQFSYDGSDFHGSQRQPNGITIQEVLEDAINILLQKKFELVFAGRTDAGVHAECMYAHFDFDTEINCESIISRLNNYLPASIAVQNIVRVKDDAHARFDAISRKYEYRICTDKNPFKNKYASRIPADIDFDIMNEAAKILLGKQDFASFCKVHTDVKTTICTITKAEWQQTGQNEWIFTIEADRFLRNMVRAIVGTLLDIGKKKQTIDDFRNIISKQHRTAAGQSAPAQGLFLVDILYPASIFTP